MKKFFSIIFTVLLISSCAQWKTEKRAIASDENEAEIKPREGVVEQKNILATMIGRKPIRTLTDLIQEGASDDELSRYNFYAIHPVLMAGYFPVKIVSQKDDGFYVLQSKVDAKIKVTGLKDSDGKEAGTGTMGFANFFLDHSNNIVFEMPDGAFNRPDFVVGKKICTKKGKTPFGFCGTIQRIYSSGELLIKLKSDITIAAIEFF